MFRWGRASVAYALFTLGALAVGHIFERGWLLTYPAPWLPLSEGEAHVFSLVLGGVFAAVVVLGTRVLVENTRWAKALHRDLRPITAGLDGAGILVIASFSGLAEELVFRGLLMPWLGLVPQSILFGVVHAQLSGPSRWVWVAWASVVGLALGIIFALSGSLLGAVLAHALINAINLAYLRSHDTAPPRPALGGLLSERKSDSEGSRLRRQSAVAAGRRA